jgi:hypothetical protein
MSTGAKLAVGGVGLALFGGLLAVLGSGKKPAPTLKSGLGKPCGACGR